MNCWRLIVFALLSLPHLAQAVVTLYHFNTCQGALERRMVGLQTSLERDFTHTPPSYFQFGPSAFTLETLTALDSVYEVFRQVLADKGRTDLEIHEFIKKLTQEDSRLSPTDTALFVWRWPPTGQILGVVRAVIVNPYTSGTKILPNDKLFKNQKAIRVELSRAHILNTKWSSVVSQEIMIAMANYFAEVFSEQDYSLHLATDASRARLYRKDYGFSIEKVESPWEDVTHIGTMMGKDFFKRYVGHVNEAYQIAFVQNQKEKALTYLRQFVAKPGLDHFIPNLKAQTIILASERRYKEALAISEELKKIGHAEVNLDYNAIWRARIAFDPITGKGDYRQAIKVLGEHVASYPPNPLSAYDGPHIFRRDRMFALQRLGIFLAAEDYLEAAKILTAWGGALISVNSEITKFSESIKQKLYFLLNAGQLPPTASLDWLNQFMDVGTSAEQPYMLSIAQSHNYELRARLYYSLGQNLLMARDLRIAAFLKSYGL